MRGGGAGPPRGPATRRTISSPIDDRRGSAWGIREPVGGVRAWPDNRAGEVAAGFTTFHAAGEARVTNIHRIADLVRGAVVEPGGTFSVNDYVGRRTRENGFVEAGAIRNGEHVSEVGGGVSQFATTLFNAAYFAGLDITTIPGPQRVLLAATPGGGRPRWFPNPELVIQNNTPYGGADLDLLHRIEPHRHGCTHTPFATGEQTGPPRAAPATAAWSPPPGPHLRRWQGAGHDSSGPPTARARARLR